MYVSFITNKDNEFEIINFGEYYFPSEELQKDLKKLIIFTENTVKHNVPNGSVFVYDKNAEYNPEILKSDVGCGITAFIMEGMPFDDKSKKEILKAVDSLNTHIGQGNHFLDFTTPHPKVRKDNLESIMVFLHSDFNNENYVPKTFEEAKGLEQRAKDKRLSYLEQLANLLGLKYEFYNDWTHNSVNLEDDFLVYRKGAINLKETNNIGLLALNPLDGLYLYAADFEEYLHSMQHGTGRIGSKGQLFERAERYAYGIARGFSFSELLKEKDVVKEIYRPIDSFMDNFWDKQKKIGYCVPNFVILTKKSRGD